MAPRFYAHGIPFTLGGNYIYFLVFTSLLVSSILLYNK